MPNELRALRDDDRRRRTMELLAKADEDMLEAAWRALGSGQPGVRRLRGPETGLVMLQGRIGGSGAPFNLGEAAVTRATVSLDSGAVGHGHTLGLSHRKAELAAIFDALGQDEAAGGSVDRLLDEIAGTLAGRDEAHQRRTAATKVDFFTVVRGED